MIDDHKLFADGLALILDNLDYEVTIEVCNDAQIPLKDIDSLKKFDLVLVDLNMPEFSGFGFLSAVQAQEIEIRTAVISGSDRKVEIERAIQLGAHGFIPKDSSGSELIHAVSQLLEGKRYLPMDWDGEIDWFVDQQASMPTAHVTKRQMQVLELLQHGLQNKQIALALGISDSSVKDHIKGLFRYFQVNNRTACVQVAREQKLL